MTYEEALLKYGKIAYETGQELRFAPIKRQGYRKWRIYLTKMETHGEEEFTEED